MAFFWKKVFPGGGSERQSGAIIALFLELYSYVCIKLR